MIPWPITRQGRHPINYAFSFLISEDGEEGMELLPTDLISGALIGTFRTVDGEKSNTFKRGAD